MGKKEREKKRRRDQHKCLISRLEGRDVVRPLVYGAAVNGVTAFPSRGHHPAQARSTTATRARF